MKRTKKLLALVLSLAMIMSVMVAPQFASATIEDGKLQIQYTGGFDTHDDLAKEFVKVKGVFCGEPDAGVPAPLGDAAPTNVPVVVMIVKDDLFGLEEVDDQETTLKGAGIDVAKVADVYIKKSFLSKAADEWASNNDQFYLMSEPGAGDIAIFDNSDPAKPLFNAKDGSLVMMNFSAMKASNFKFTVAPLIDIDTPGDGHKALKVKEFVMERNTISKKPIPVESMFKATIGNVVPGREYAYEVSIVSLDGVDKKLVVLSDTQTASKMPNSNHTLDLDLEWDGLYINSEGNRVDLPEVEEVDVTYSLKVTDTVEGTALVTVYDATEDSRPDRATSTITTYIEEVLKYSVVANNIPTSVTPGTNYDFGFTLGGYVKSTMGELYMIVQDKDGNGVACVKNSGTEAAAKFVWNGYYVDERVAADTVSGFTKSANFSAGKAVPAADYFVALQSTKTAKTDSIKTTVVAAPNLLYGIDVKYASVNNVDPGYLTTKDGKVTITVNANKAGAQVLLNFKDKDDKIAHSVSMVTSGTDNSATALLSNWDGLVKEDKDGKVYLADGVYTLEANIVGSTLKPVTAKLQVGSPVNITNISTKDALVSLPLGVPTLVELVFNDTKADLSDIKSITLDKANDYFAIDGSSANWKDKSIVLIGKKLTTETVTATATAVLNDGKDPETKVVITFKVQVIPAATDIELKEKFIRGKVGATGKSVEYKFLPEGSTGNAPEVYPAKKNADGTYTKLEGADLEKAKTINSVDEKLDITFTAPERIVYVANYNGKLHEVVILTTVDAAQELVFYPADGEITIPAGIMADPAKQPRVAAYVRPVHVADTKVTYTTSDATKVSFLYATFAGATSITNDAVTIPAGGNAGALVGLMGEATITATSTAKSATNEVLSHSILVKVAPAATPSATK